MKKLVTHGPGILLKKKKFCFIDVCSEEGFLEQNTKLLSLLF